MGQKSSWQRHWLAVRHGILILFPLLSLYLTFPLHFPSQVMPLVKTNVEQLEIIWKKIDEEYGRILTASQLGISSSSFFFFFSVVCPFLDCLCVSFRFVPRPRRSSPSQ
jgi:hypothetical protein